MDSTRAKIGSTVEAKLVLQLREGYHVNSNTPAEDYLIPLKLTWNAGPLSPVEVIFPKPRLEKYQFSEKPLSVFSGTFEVTARFKVAATATSGYAAMTGKLRYQACTDRMCLTPKNMDISIPLEILK